MSHLDAFLDLAVDRDHWTRPALAKGKYATHRPSQHPKELNHTVGDSPKVQEEELALQPTLVIQEQYEQDDDELIWLQNQLLAEELKFEEQLSELALQQRPTFECGICLEAVPVGDAVRMEGCDHELCRVCMKGYVTSKIQERRYPILCPLCQVADGETEGVIVEEIVQSLRISKEDLLIFEELQMLQFAIPIECRRCKNTAYIDREEHSEAKVLTCPLPGCCFKWCKWCHQEADPDAQSEHSCDGADKLEEIIKGLDWKRCPQCATPVERVTGCNHLTCISPGCNTHFCYKCGDAVYRGAWNNVANEAKWAHLRGPCGIA